MTKGQLDIKSFTSFTGRYNYPFVVPQMAPQRTALSESVSIYDFKKYTVFFSKLKVTQIQEELTR